MEMITRKKSNQARAVARMKLPPLRVDDGLVELSIQEYSAKMRWVASNYPADRIPAVGDEIEIANADGTIESAFMVMEVKHLLVPRERKRQFGPFCYSLRGLTTPDCRYGSPPLCCKATPAP
jgi:hypothetical protein